MDAALTKKITAVRSIWPFLYETIICGEGELISWLRRKIRTVARSTSAEHRFIFNWTSCEFTKIYLWYAFSVYILVGSLNPNMTPKSWSHFTTLTWSGARPVYHMITLRSLTCATSRRLGQRTWDHQISLMDTAVIWWPLLSRLVVGKLEWSSEQTGLRQAEDSTPVIQFFVTDVSCRLFKIHSQIIFFLTELSRDIRYYGHVQNYF